MKQNGLLKMPGTLQMSFAGVCMEGSSALGVSK